MKNKKFNTEIRCKTCDKKRLLCLSFLRAGHHAKYFHYSSGLHVGWPLSSVSASERGNRGLGRLAIVRGRAVRREAGQTRPGRTTRAAVVDGSRHALHQALLEHPALTVTARRGLSLASPPSMEGSGGPEVKQRAPLKRLTGGRTNTDTRAWVSSNHCHPDRRELPKRNGQLPTATQ